ncbi:MAG: diacylglycerol kinase family lipid kinase [Firmicutes bacterium]|nr:diacylglycerol kinase family lipid kinase [Bacillota bacterium]
MKITIIVNPNAGKRSVQKQLELIAGRLLLSGIARRVDIVHTQARGHATAAAAALQAAECDLIIACGGDGTINEVLNGLMQSGSRIPVAILAAGTSNDFATALRLPDTAAPFCEMVRAGRYEQVDIGCANGRYFMNAAAFGMFTEVAHGTNQKQKNNLGKLAYYLQAVREAPEQLAFSMPLSISSREYTAEGNYSVCLIVNSMSVASMRRLMRRADVTDGLFDVLLMKKRPPLNNAEQIVHVIQQSGERFFGLAPESKEEPAAEEPPALPAAPRLHELLKPLGADFDPTFVYFQTAHVTFSSPEGDNVVTDVDGERFGHLPLTIDVVPQAIRLLVPPEEPAGPAVPAIVRRQRTGSGTKRQ